MICWVYGSTKLGSKPGKWIDMQELILLIKMYKNQE